MKKFNIDSYSAEVSPTKLVSLKFDCDIKPQRCFKVVIREVTRIQTSMLILHGTLKCEASVNQLHTLRQGSIISAGQIHKEEFMFLLECFSNMKIVISNIVLTAHEKFR